MQPSTDLCHTCQKNTEKISGRAGASEEDKIAAVEAHSDHLRKAKREREIYNSAVDSSKDFLMGSFKGFTSLPQSTLFFARNCALFL